MKRMIGIAGIAALGALTYVSVHALLAKPSLPGGVSVPSGLDDADLQERIEVIETRLERVIPGVPATGRPLPSNGTYGEATRGVGIKDVVVSPGGRIMFLGDGMVYHRDESVVCAWVARLSDASGETVLLEWPYLEDAFVVEAGEMIHPTYLGVLPFPVGPGDYLLELMIASPYAAEGSKAAAASQLAAKYPFSVE